MEASGAPCQRKPHEIVRLAARLISAQRCWMESFDGTARRWVGGLFGPQVGDHAEVVTRVGALEGRVEAHACVHRLAAMALVAATDEDVVDAAVGLAQRSGERVATREGDAGGAVARQLE